MAYTDIQGSEVLLQLSSDNFTTTYSIVCLQTADFNLKSPVTTEESQCGTHTAIGKGSFTVNFSGIMSSSPAVPSGSPSVGQASYKQLLSWASSQQLLSFRMQHGTLGVDFFESGSCYLSDLTRTWGNAQLVKFSGTLTGTGDIDIIP